MDTDWEAFYERYSDECGAADIVPLGPSDVCCPAGMLADYMETLTVH